MAASACRRLVLCSSFTVYDYSSIDRILDEDSPVYQARDIYARDGYTIAKWWQERVTRRFVEKYGWDLTVLRPGNIWGRDRGYLAIWRNVHPDVLAIVAPNISPGPRPGVFSSLL